MFHWSQLCLDLDAALKCRRTKLGARSIRLEIKVQNADNSLVVCDESGHTKLPLSSVVLSWGELWLVCPELSLIPP